MSFIAPVFKIHYIGQKFIPLPFYLNISTKQLSLNPLYNQTRHKLYRYFSWIAVMLTWSLNEYRLIWFFYNWILYTKSHIGQAVLYLLAFLGQTLGLAAFTVYGLHQLEYVYCVNQCIKLTNEQRPFFIRLPFLGKIDVKVLFIYAFSTPFSLFPVTFASIPLAISWCPIQLVLGSSNFVKIFASLFYWFSVLYLAWIAVSIFLLFFLVLDTILTLSSKFQAHGTHLHRPCSGEGCPNEVMIQKRHMISTNFNRSFKRYLKVRLLIILLSNVITTFLTVLAFIGILLISFATFATLKLAKFMHILLYISAPVVAIGGFVFTIVVSHMADVPYRNSLNFGSFWKRKLTRRADRMRLRSCLPIGLSLGPYGIATASLGLNICNVIVDNTVTILLIGVVD